jgi:hypothetical protein
VTVGPRPAKPQPRVRGLPRRVAFRARHAMASRSATSDIPPAKSLPASHFALPPDLGRWEKTGLSVHGSATMRSSAPAARVEGTVNSSRECVMAFIKRHWIAVFFVLAYALTGWATPWNGSFAPGVLLAALIVVTLTEGLSGLEAPAGMPARPRHRAIAEREELR